MPFTATWMDLEITILSKVSQREKDKYHMVWFKCGIKRERETNLFPKQKETHRHRKQIYGYQSGKVGEDKLRDYN